MTTVFIVDDHDLLPGSPDRRPAPHRDRQRRPEQRGSEMGEPVSVPPAAIVVILAVGRRDGLERLVEILQHDWMRDDLTTLTNTYPDHEDLQGPAGFDIPHVMTRFIPRGVDVHSSEDQMLPILADDAHAKNTRLSHVGWLEAGLITSDLLERFPYAEHPFNIALVVRMAAELGVEADFAVKEMADRVVEERSLDLTGLSLRDLEPRVRDILGWAA